MPSVSAPINLFTVPQATTSPTLPTVPLKDRMKTMFSDTSLVCYKPGSLAPGGIGSVRNSRLKAKRT